MSYTSISYFLSYYIDGVEHRALDDLPSLLYLLVRLYCGYQLHGIEFVISTAHYHRSVLHAGYQLLASTLLVLATLSQG
jgi:hypothetical protein